MRARERDPRPGLLREGAARDRESRPCAQRVASEWADWQRALAGEHMTGPHRDCELLTEEFKPLRLRRGPLLERERHVESASLSISGIRCAVPPHRPTSLPGACQGARLVRTRHQRCGSGDDPLPPKGMWVVVGVAVLLEPMLVLLLRLLAVLRLLSQRAWWLPSRLPRWPPAVRLRDAEPEMSSAC